MNALKGILDSELLEMLREEYDTLAFSELYNRYWDRVFSAAYKRVRSVEVAEEIVQDLFTDLWSRRKSLDIKSELPVYLFSAVKYRVINYLHKEQVKNSFATNGTVYTEFDNSTEELVIANDLKSHLENKVQSLPDKCREVYELSRNGHQSNKAIAQQLSISEKTVENQITKALKKLRTSLNSFFF
jgi:RNA polymerase sigma-70 factor (family 1)